MRASFIAGACGPASRVPTVCSCRCHDDRHRFFRCLATIRPAFTGAERLALAGFLAGYRGVTREACTLDLRQFTGWCRARSLPLFSVRRADLARLRPRLVTQPAQPSGLEPHPPPGHGARHIRHA
ncbi:MAG: hypothetical protein ACRDP7_30980 [Trebonia sp.]